MFRIKCPRLLEVVVRQCFCFLKEPRSFDERRRGSMKEAGKVKSIEHTVPSQSIFTFSSWSDLVRQLNTSL
jgi:hypothetical protein